MITMTFTNFDIAFMQLIEEGQQDWWEIIEGKDFEKKMADKLMVTVDELIANENFDKWHTMACQEL